MAFQLVFVLVLLKAVAFGEARVVALSNRIINGKPVAENAFPWHVSITSSNTNRTVQCSGSIVSFRWILTAGQCVHNFDRFEVTLGASGPTGSQCKLLSNESFIHPSYKGSLSNDIALIKLPSAIMFTESIAPIKLPDKSHSTITFVGSNTRVSGWNTTTSFMGAYRTFALHWVELSVITNTRCAQYLGSQITQSSMCADAIRQGNISEGDYGSAMVVYEDDIWMQIGVASYVQPASVGTMSAYTRLSSYIDWLEKTIIESKRSPVQEQL